ncbi:hypothetical protein AB0C02_32220 [Micromonospora sp. NPDC048999]|uniref:hypothetical protein n=1 Tax=Micromonospora sp. NPDC048999 TaxID=3155391 RepID=UPI0033E68E28
MEALQLTPAAKAHGIALGISAELPFRTKGQLAIDICTDAYADGIRFAVVFGDEVYGASTQLRESFEQQQQARVASTFAPWGTGRRPVRHVKRALTQVRTLPEQLSRLSCHGPCPRRTPPQWRS